MVQTYINLLHHSLLVSGVTRTGKDKFDVQRSGLFIPTEMLTGQTAHAFQDLISSDLVPRVGHELGRILAGR